VADDPIPDPGARGDETDPFEGLTLDEDFVRGAALVVDAGTAMTVDALATDGRFLGGLIVPGYDLMRASLARGTARLPVAAGRFDPFPRTTDDAIVTGALQAMAGAVVRTLEAILAEQRKANAGRTDATGGVRAVGTGGQPPSRRAEARNRAALASGRNDTIDPSAQR
jgi:pantothenate kinase type III